MLNLYRAGGKRSPKKDSSQKTKEKRGVDNAGNNDTSSSRHGLELPSCRIADEFSSEKWRSRTSLLVIDGKDLTPALQYDPTPKASEWTRSGSETSENTLPTRSDSKSSSGSTTTLGTVLESPHQTPSSQEPAIQAIESLDSLPARPALRRTSSQTSTLFQHSASAPVTITITTPEDEPSSLALISARPRASRSHSLPTQHLSPPNASTVSLPLTSFFDDTRLMPPSEHQMDKQRLRKAHEYREMRHFIIGFLDTKGHEFPLKLRTRMMDGYGIELADLAPETVERFKRMQKDEGQALAQLGLQGAESNRENLRILESAFRSRIPDVTPRLDPDYVNAVHPGRLARRSSTKPRMPKSRRIEEGDETSDILGSTLSTTNLSTFQSQAQHNLKSSSSTPNLHRRPAGPALTSAAVRDRTGSVSSKPRDWELLGTEKQMRVVENQTRVRRQSIISGAFGAVREAFGGSKAGKEAKRRRMVAEDRG